MSEPTPEPAADTGLPTPDCTIDQHDQMGGGCLHCCEQCARGVHRCPACSRSLRHDGKEWVDQSNHLCPMDPLYDELIDDLM